MTGPIECSVCGQPVDLDDWNAAPVWADPEGRSATAHARCFEEIRSAFDDVFMWESGL